MSFQYVGLFFLFVELGCEANDEVETAHAAIQGL